MRNNNQVKTKVLMRSNFADSEKGEVRKKMSLDEQIKSFVESPGLEKYWYQKLVRRVQNDQKRKLAEVKDPVRLNKHQTSQRTKISTLKSLFRQLIEFLCP